MSYRKVKGLKTPYGDDAAIYFDKTLAAFTEGYLVVIGWDGNKASTTSKVRGTEAVFNTLDGAVNFVSQR